MAAAGTVGEALTAAGDALRAAGVESPRLDAELLLEAASGRGRAALVASPEAEVAASDGRAFGAMVRRRLRREPVAYILGYKGFRHLELRVDERVLVPRPESELLVELALELGPETVLDVGTGSGAIALAIAGELPGCRVRAVDSSAGAIELARRNAARHGLATRVELGGGEAASLEGRFDLVVANLPYVAEADYRGLAAEITDHEPREALLGGRDGLEVIRELVGRLGPGADSPLQAPAVGLEIGAEQGEAVSELLRSAGFTTVGVRQDLAGLDRVVVGRGQS